MSDVAAYRQTGTQAIVARHGGGCGKSWEAGATASAGGPAGRQAGVPRRLMRMPCHAPFSTAGTLPGEQCRSAGSSGRASEVGHDQWVPPAPRCLTLAFSRLSTSLDSATAVCLSIADAGLAKAIMQATVASHPSRPIHSMLACKLDSASPRAWVLGRAGNVVLGWGTPGLPGLPPPPPYGHEASSRMRRFLREQLESLRTQPGRCRNQEPGGTWGGGPGDQSRINGAGTLAFPDTWPCGLLACGCPGRIDPTEGRGRYAFRHQGAAARRPQGFTSANNQPLLQQTCFD